MPWAIDDKISKSELQGGLPIDENEYTKCKRHMMAGGLVKVWGAELILTEKPERLDGHLEPVWIDGSWHHEPEPEPELETNEQETTDSSDGTVSN